MRSFVAVLLVACLCDAKPMQIEEGAIASFGTGPLFIDNFIIGGQDAVPGAWPWQLSQQRLGSTWSHSCGASLLSTTKALSASHCVDGTAPSAIRVIAGLHDRTDLTGTQTSNAASYTMHERYQVDTATYSNDVSIINLVTPIVLGGNVALLTLPPDNSNSFAGRTCTVTGWGRTSASNVLPNILQQADITILTTAECASRMSSVSGTQIWDGHICIFDPAGVSGSCNGDSGGPLNCPNGSGGYWVAGVTSWVVASALGNCLVSYPSVYTRTGYYLDWINSN
jgi:secreted trypsin-like serine protease